MRVTYTREKDHNINFYYLMYVLCAHRADRRVQSVDESAEDHIGAAGAEPARFGRLLAHKGKNPRMHALILPMNKIANLKGS